VAIVKIIPNVLGAQVHFTTTQQLFSSSSEQKTQLLYFEVFFSKTNTVFFHKIWETCKIPPAKMIKFLLRLSVNNRG